jgi:glycosyltransferase involved in cell wall biosynthesis
MKHILIMEISLNGHHAVYLEHICNAYLEEGYFVTVTLHTHCEHYSVLKRLQNKYKENLSFVIIEELEFKSKLRKYGGNIAVDFSNWLIFKRKFKYINSKLKVDYLLIPYLDYCINTAALLGSPAGLIPWSGIYMQPTFHHRKFKLLQSASKFNIIKEFLFYKLLNNEALKSLFIIDELLFNDTIGRRSTVYEHLEFLADPAELTGDHTYISSREKLNIPSNSITILVYGLINERKGLKSLISAIDHSDVPKTVYIIIAGIQDSSIKDFFKSEKITKLIKSQRLIIINKVVDNHTQQMVFAAADIIWLGYENHSAMSGVLVLAAMAKKVVLSNCNGLIGWYTEQKGMGLSVNTSNISEVRRALITLCDKSIRLQYELRNTSPFEEHTWENAIKKILTPSKLIVRSDK